MADESKAEGFAGCLILAAVVAWFIPWDQDNLGSGFHWIASIGLASIGIGIFVIRARMEAEKQAKWERDAHLRSLQDERRRELELKSGETSTVPVWRVFAHSMETMNS